MYMLQKDCPDGQLSHAKFYFLKLLTELELTTRTGKLFHIFMIFWVKKNIFMHIIS